MLIVPGTGGAARIGNLRRRQLSGRPHEIVSCRAAGDRQRLARKVSGVLEMTCSELIVRERDRWSRKTTVRRIVRIDDHLVRIVAIVQPVPVDEAMLEAGKRHGTPATLQRDGAADSSRFRVGQTRGGLPRVQDTRHLIHRAGSPRPLQPGDAEELFTDDRPAVAVPDHRPTVKVVAREQSVQMRLPLPPHLPPFFTTGIGRELLERWCAVAPGRQPPPSCAKIPARSDAHQAQHACRHA